jgi:electron transport complex protein RnfG
MATPAEPEQQAPRPRKGPGPAASVATLIVVAIVLTGVLTLVARQTHEKIERNAAAWILQRLDTLVPAALHDNDLLEDHIDIVSPEILGINDVVPIYRARMRGQPVAAVMRTVAPDGYRGPIELLIAIRYDGTLIGVQVIRHKETPGLGDAFENRDIGWLPRFRDRSLLNPPQQRWTVRKDGGDFDEFTGATITPRAIVKATRRALEYYGANRERVFAPAAGK